MNIRRGDTRIDAWRIVRRTKCLTFLESQVKGVKGIWCRECVMSIPRCVVPEVCASNGELVQNA